ncbi:MAG: ATP-binding protein [Deltaproteobacteria bacterium]|nr:ATP-binding protein [Deltaproteobacteria bacterium]
MSKAAIRPWVEVVSLHPDVLSENFSEDIFALDLGSLADGNPNVPAVYRDPEHFFRASYITSGLRSLLQDALSRLEGGEGSRVLKLMTPFGGGKSHTLAALFHAAKNRKALDVVPEGKGLPRPRKEVRTAVFDGQFFDATKGKAIPGEKFRARTMWGWIAWSLGRTKGYEFLRAQDEARVAPGADEILTLLAEGPNLILLDETLNYLISALGLKVEQTTLCNETLTFLQRLTVAVANTTNTALVFSLQSSKRESLDYVNLLQTVDHLAARKDQLREPVEGNEVLAVIQRRLLGKLPEAEAGMPAAAAYQEIVTQMRRAYAQSTSERQQAEEEGIALRDRVRAAYPFHPALIDLMRERWAAIPDFQRTRGALRFLAACLRASHREGKSRAVLGPGDVPMHDPEVRLAFFKEVGQQADFQAVLEHDFIGANARARRIDERRAKENSAEALRKPAIRVATAILMYSFGGLRRLPAAPGAAQAGDGGKDGDLLPPGISEPELLATCVGPDLDSTTVVACLKELKEQCLYLHFDGVRYCFKKDPNITLLIEQEADAVGRDEKRVRERIKEMLEERLANHREAIIWPDKSIGIDDRDPSFLIAYLPLEFGGTPRAAQEATAKELLEKCGDKPRQYRNGLGLAIPAADQIEILRRSVRYLMAAEQVKTKSKQLNLTDEQRSQLRERESTEQAAAESALLKLYTEVWLPRVENGGLGIERVAAGGRPLQTTLNEKKQAKIHERIIELITQVQPRVFPTVKATKIVELFKLGGGQPPLLGKRTCEIVDGFYSFLGFTRLLSAIAIRKGIAEGVGQSAFGYTAGSVPTLGPDGRYQLPLDKVRFGPPQVPDDEIDLDSGFLIMPAAIPKPAAGPEPIPPEPTPPGPGGGPEPIPLGPVPPGPMAQKSVELTFDADRNQLYTAWQAIANLADLAGKVAVTVKAESEKGFDQSKLRNGVLEPLEEADLIK